MTQVFRHFDYISIQDVLKNTSRFEFQKRNNKSPVLGLVRIFENGKLNTDQTEDGWLTNMTIATGREFIGQSIFKKSSPDSIFGNITNYKVDAFGVGSGGSILDVNNNITLNGPALCDIGMYNPLAINTNCLDAVDNNGTVQSNIVKFVESAGPGGVQGTIEFEKSLSTEFTTCSQDYYTVIKLTCVIDNQEPSFLNPGESARIDEAMLFFTSDSGTNPLPFAHICFSPKFIELETAFKIEWYVIC
jgi:hypothetical protein